LEEKILLQVNDERDVVSFSKTLKEGIVPIFKLSNVTGYNMDLFKSFLNLLPVNNQLSSNVDMHSEFFIHTIFTKENNIILGGTVIKGKIGAKQILSLGPDQKGDFRGVTVENIQCKKVPVTYAICGQSCTVKIKPGTFCKAWLDQNKDGIRRGMVLVDSKSKPRASLGFIAEINSFKEEPTIIWENHEPVVTSQTTHQVCTIVFDNLPPEEIKEADIPKIKTYCENLPNFSSKGKKSEDTSPEEMKELASISLQRHKSKSQDDKLSSSLKQKKKYSTELDNSPIKAHSFSRRNLANLFLSSEDLTRLPTFDSAKNGVQTELPVAVDRRISDNTPSPTESPDKVKKPSFEDKIKNLKKNIYMYAEDLHPKKKKNMKFITFQPNNTKTLKFMFKYHPEYLTKGQKIIINDSSMKVIGTVVDVIYPNTNHTQ